MACIYKINNCKNNRLQELTLPAPIADKTLKTDIESVDNDMRIAWRYNSLPQFDSSVESKNKYISNFDLSHKIKTQDIENSDIELWNFDENAKDSKLDALLKSIHNKVNLSQFPRYINSISPEDHLRICIQSIGSPLWYSSNLESELVRFFAILKTLVKSSKTVCVLTLPSHLLEKFFKSHHTLHRIYNVCDFVIELKSICKNDDLKTIFKEYSGILNLKKLSAVNALSINYTGTYDLGYKMSMKKFTIETLHLPPDIPENDDGKNASGLGDVPGMACAGGPKKHLLEF